MREKILNRFKQGFKGGIERFPQATFLCAVCTILLIVNRAIYGGSYGLNIDEGIYVKWVMAISLGIPIAVGINLYHEKKEKSIGKKGIIAYAMGVVFIFAYRFLALEFDSIESVIRFVATFLLLWAVAIAVCHMGEERNLDLHITKIFVRLSITVLYSGVIYSGVAGLLATMDFLLGVDIRGDMYYYLAVVTFTLFAAIFFITGIPKYWDQLNEKSCPKVLKILIFYIVIPILMGYTIIIYIYFIKIIAMWKWPDIMVSHLVLWYSIISIIVMVLITSIKEEKGFVNLYYKINPILMIPLIGLMFLAMGIRIRAYGITANRYIVLALGIWVILCALKYIIKKDKMNSIVPISLAAILLVSIYGPLSSFEVDKRSQNKRFEMILKKYNKLESGKLVASDETISDEDKESVRSIINHFIYDYSKEELKALPEEFNADMSEKLLGFRYYDYNTEDRRNIVRVDFGLDDRNRIIQVKGFDYLILSRYYRLEEDNESVYTTSFKDNNIELFHYGDKVYSYNIEEFIIDLIKTTGKYSGYDIERSKMIIEDETENYKIKIQIDSFGSDYNEKEESLSNGYCNFTILLKETGAI